MRNITKLFIAGVMAIPLVGTAQVSTNVEPRNAVLEEWTGMHCGYCPTGAFAMEEAFINNPGRVSIVSMHAGGYATPSGAEPDYRTAEGTVSDGTFPITGYPASTLNRRTIGGDQVYHPASSNDADKVPAILSENSEVNLYGTATLDIVTRLLTVNIEYYYTSNAPSTTNYMNVAINQNNVQGLQDTYGAGSYNPPAWIDYPTIYNHMHMFRGYMNGTGQWGDAINSTTTGSTATLTYSQTLPMDINGIGMDLANIEIAAFIGDGFEDAGDILTGLTIVPVLTGFTATDEVIFSSASSDDLNLCDVSSPETSSPIATIQNWGSNPMTSATITYDVNGGAPVVMNWTGSIAPGASEMITLDPITYTPISGTNTLNVTVSNPNGVADNTADNSGSTTFEVQIASPTEVFVTVDLHTDSYGDETWMEITNSVGTIVWSEGNENVQGNYNTGQFPPTADPTNPLANDTDYSWQVTLPAIDCYEFHIYDYYGDGLSDGGTGAGYDVKDNTGAVIITESPLSFGDQSGLINNGSVGINEITFENVSIFPNPASEVINVNFSTEATDFVVSILDLQGRVLASQSGSQNVTFPVADLASGSYLVTISTENGVHTESVVIK